MEAEREATTRRLHSKADAAWKKMHEVMYNHQLEYDWRLANFLKEAEMMLANMRDQIWTTVHALVESEGMTFEDCLSLVLCILLLLPQIPMDIPFQMQIPLTIAYCPESSVYRRWHSERGGVSPLRKEGQSIQDPDQGVGWGHPPRKQGNGLSTISHHLQRLCGIRWAVRLQSLIT